MFGLFIGNKKHAWCLFNVMLALYVLSFAVAWYCETRPNPVMAGVMPNMEGKEQRIGVMNSVLWGISARPSTTARSIQCTTVGCHWPA